MEPRWVSCDRSPSDRTEFNAGHYCSFVLTKLSKIARQFRNKARRTLILHADNARPHNTKSSIEFYPKPDVRVTRHPPCSPDLAPSDCFLLGYIKDKLKDLSFPSALQLHRAITQTIRSIDRSTLIATFNQWIVRLEK
jgi:hypothetical protein